MDKNLNSSPKLPWWLVMFQILPLILPLVNEIILRTQGGHYFPNSGNNLPETVVIPDPLEVPADD